MRGWRHCTDKPAPGDGREVRVHAHATRMLRATHSRFTREPRRGALLAAHTLSIREPS
jgi:hypothetical protein